jgi:hypothetical protein
MNACKATVPEVLRYTGIQSQQLTASLNKTVMCRLSNLFIPKVLIVPCYWTIML